MSFFTPMPLIAPEQRALNVASFSFNKRQVANIGRINQPNSASFTITDGFHIAQDHMTKR